MRRLRHKLRQESANLLDKKALQGIQEKLQDALDEERETFLERARYERVSEEQFRGYRNGHGDPRQVHLGSGSIRVRLPRVADNAEPFESGLLSRYQRSSPAVLATLPQL